MSWMMKIALIIILWGLYGEFEKSDDATGIWMLLLTFLIIIG